MTDQLDAASDIEQLERAAAIARHQARTREPVPLCENCDEHLVHVTDSGTRWRFCAPCAEEHLRGGV
jgi:hypothetical protein